MFVLVSTGREPVLRSLKPPPELSLKLRDLHPGRVLSGAALLPARLRPPAP
jgi:hypothetical protein